MTGEPIRNKVSGEESRAQIVLPDGFEYDVAEIGSASSQTHGPVQVDFATVRPVRPPAPHAATGASAPGELDSARRAVALSAPLAVQPDRRRSRAGGCSPGRWLIGRGHAGMDPMAWHGAATAYLVPLIDVVGDDGGDDAASAAHR